jgi:hypothetical protein
VHSVWVGRDGKSVIVHSVWVGRDGKSVLVHSVWVERDVKIDLDDRAEQYHDDMRLCLEMISDGIVCYDGFRHIDDVNLLFCHLFTT